MIKIINGKKYNTATAEAVGLYNNGLGRADFMNLTETLYRKRTGEFFLYGQGGGMTKYAKRVGSSFTYGEAIIPLTFDEAKKWTEEHMEVEEYEAVFGEVPEDDAPAKSAEVLELRKVGSSWRPTGYLTSYEYAEKIGVRESTVRKWAAFGKLESIKIGRSCWVREDEPVPPNISKMSTSEKEAFMKADGRKLTGAWHKENGEGWKNNGRS